MPLIEKLLRRAGWIPVSEAAAYAEIDVELTALGIDPADRRRAFDSVRIITQLGIDPEDVEDALIAHARYGHRDQYDLMRIRRYIDQILAENGHLPNE